MNEELKQLKERVDNLARQNQELLEWKRQKTQQQISYPLDDPSRNIVGGLQDDGPGATSLTQVYTDNNAVSGGDTHTGTKAYAGTRLILINGTRYEIPYIATS